MAAEPLTIFNHLGICQGHLATKRNIDILCEESDSEMLKWKARLEEPLHAKDVQAAPENISQAPPAADNASQPGAMWSLVFSNSDSLSEPDEEFLPLADVSDKNIHNSSSDASRDDPASRFREDSDSTPISMPVDDDNASENNECVGLALVWDNIQKAAQGRDVHNKLNLWANAYAAENGVDRSDLDGDNFRLRAKDILLPAPSGWSLHDHGENAVDHGQNTCVPYATFQSTLQGHNSVAYTTSPLRRISKKKQHTQYQYNQWISVHHGWHKCNYAETPAICSKTTWWHIAVHTNTWGWIICGTHDRFQEGTHGRC